MGELINLNKPSRSGFITNYPDFRYWKSRGADLRNQSLNIYVHIPFCIQKCAYCYYFTLKYKGQDQVEDYVSSLCQEISIKSRIFQLNRRKINSIYLGGGTPSILKKEQLLKIKECIESNFELNGYEFTIEAEPHTINKNKIAEFKDAGITRISLGVQSFCDDVIKLSERKHSKQKALDTINLILDKGHHILNIDLLSGLAGDTLTTWEDTVDTALASGVHNITIYKMEAYSNTLFFNSGIRKNQIELPSEKLELEFMKLAIDKIGKSIYKPWSTFTFIKDDKYAHEYIHNIWHGADLCSFGPSAYSKIGSFCHQNTNSYKNYFSKIEEDELPINRGYTLNSKDEQVQDILLGFKFCQFDRISFYNKHGFDIYGLLKEDVERLIQNGFVLVDETSVILTSKGLLYGDFVGKYIAGAFKKLFGKDEFSLN